MKTIKALCSKEGRVYVYLSSSAICDLFLQNAEAEGFLFCDGIKPTQKKHDSIFAVNQDMTLNYVGYIGHAAYGSGTQQIGNKKLIRIDYEKYIGE